MVLLTVSPALAQDYAIKMLHPLKAGQRYAFTSKASEANQSSMTAQGKVLKNAKDAFSAEMESEVTVLEVDSKGRPTKESHVVARLVKDAAREEVLPAGAKVVASRPGTKMAFQVNGEPATPDVAKILNIVISITSGGPSDDEVFGSTQRKKVGDTWPINKDVVGPFRIVNFKRDRPDGP